MRCLAGHFHFHNGNAAGGQADHVLIDAATLKRHDRIVFFAQADQQGAGAGGADFFVAVDGHSEFGVIVKADVLQHFDGVQDQGNTPFVIRDGQAISPIAVDAKGLFGHHALQVDRVHVGDQQDFFLAFAFFGAQNHRAQFGTLELRVKVRCLGGDGFDFHAHLLQTLGQQLAELFKPLQIAAAGLDGDQFFERVQHRRRLGLRQGLHTGVGAGRGSLSPCRHQQRSAATDGEQSFGCMPA